MTEHQTAQVMWALEECTYGHRLSSEQLAEKATVSLDIVNRVERYLPLESEHVAERISNALGIPPELLGKVAGLADITWEEWETLQSCLPPSPPGQPVPSQCERLGFRRRWT